MKPRRFRDIIWKSMTGSQVPLRIVVARPTAGSIGEPSAAPGSRRAPPSAPRRGDQVVAAAEAGAVAGERDHVDRRVEIRPLDAGGQLARHLERDPVAALGPVQRDAGDPARRPRRSVSRAVHHRGFNQRAARAPGRQDVRLAKEAHDDRGGRAARSGSRIRTRSTSRSRAITKLDLAEYYLAVADAALIHLRERPTTMKRFVDGVEGEFFFQKRVPKGAPDWLADGDRHTSRAGAARRELVANDAAHLVWAVNLGVIDFNPWPVRRADLDHPDELRVDLDPTPEVGLDDVRKVAMVVREVLDDHGLRRLPEDVGLARHPRQRPGRARAGLHRGPPRRARAGARGRAARAEAGDQQVVEGGAPRRLRRLQPERARPHRRLRLLGPPDRRRPRLAPRSSGTRSPDVDPAELRARHRPGPARASAATRRPTIDERPGSLDSLLELADRDEAEGLGDAPWPPHFRKQKGEPKRVQPSKAKQEPA